jgi:arylsulfatase A-like enzyme
LKGILWNHAWLEDLQRLNRPRADRMAELIGAERTYGAGARVEHSWSLPGGGSFVSSDAVAIYPGSWDSHLPASMAGQSGPNVVIVVADCLREDEFYRECKTSPFLSGLRREAVTFPQCSSVSNWTVPAHASILTGLYPFEHNVHRLGIRSLPPDLPTIATSLSALGYATQLLSANHTLRPETGFGTGFDYVAWGIWGETALRITSDAHPPFDSRMVAGVDLLKDRLIENEPTGLWKVAERAAVTLPRFPWILDGVSRVHAALFRKGARRDYRVAPWVEPSLHRFLDSAPRSQPILSVLNLMDCHEPYLPEPTQNLDPASWLRLVTSRQDVVSWARGHWLPTRQQLDVLRELYRQKVRVLGVRVGQIVDLLKAASRWDNTLFILTGDHGQAFGEHGQLFHSGELFEPVTHVPMWIRYPSGEYGGTVAKAHASLVDVYPTVMEVVDRTLAGTWSGLPLGRLFDTTRPDQAISTADGMSVYGSAEAPAPSSWESPQVAVYSERYKLMVDYSSGRTRAYRLPEDPEESTDVWPSMESELRTMRVKAREIGSMMLQRSPVSYECAATTRLSRWGYLD